MARISLRAYLNEIESLINKGRYEEAIAHCRHILQSFPKSVHTYRLLGKSFLEARRYTDAIDIFQRLLSAIPDDFVSHLGLSIIREDEANLDAAIWHMERAFEIQPYNGAIQEELKRLYQRRDGSAPPRIRLTRGALARMYARGHLYQQAIAEIRAALAKDPQRIDLQVILAAMYLASAKHVEAADVGSKILRKLPYCLEANRILAEVLQASGKSAEAQPYSTRLHALDPYTAYLTPETPSVDQVPESSVTLEKLEISVDQLATAAQASDWMASLGLTVTEEEALFDEELPEWLIAAAEALETTGPDTPAAAEEGPETTALLATEDDLMAKLDTLEWVGDESQPPAGDLALEPTPEAEAEEALPDWLSEAEWPPAEPAEPPAAELTPEAELAPEAEELAEGGDIPDWLKSLAPAEGEAAEEAEDSALAALLDEAALEQEIPPADIMAEVDMQETAIAAPEGEPPAEDDWLSEFEAQIAQRASPEPAEITPPEADAEAAALEETGEETPEWRPEFEAEAPAAEAELPDWLADLEVEAGAEEAPQPAAEAAEAELPDWLADLEVEAGVEESPRPAAEAELPDWLADLEVEAGAEEAPQPAAEAELPDWLADLEVEAGMAEAPQPAAEAQPPTASEVPDWLKEFADEAPTAAAPTAEAAPAELESPPDFADADEAMAWLAGLAATAGEQSAAEEPEAEVEPGPEMQADIAPAPVEEAEERAAELAAAETPEMEEPHAEAAQPEAPAAGDLAKTAVWETPAELKGGAELESPPDFADMEAAIAWLEGLAAQQGAKEEELFSAPEERRDTAPAWVQKMIDQQPAAVEPQPQPADEATPAEAEDVRAEDAGPQTTFLDAQAEEAEETTPIERIDLNAASLVELERLPGVGFRLAQSIIACREERRGFERLEDLLEVEGLTADDLPLLARYLEVSIPAAPAPAAPPQEPATPASAALKNTLQEARNALAAGDQAAALAHYQALIRAHDLLSDVIFDLSQALHQQPDSFDLWQTLGDAYLRDHQTEQAMEAYQRAEELLY